MKLGIVKTRSECRCVFQSTRPCLMPPRSASTMNIKSMPLSHSHMILNYITIEFKIAVYSDVIVHHRLVQCSHISMHSNLYYYL